MNDFSLSRQVRYKATPDVVVTLQEITRVIATKVPEEIDACLHDGSLWLLRDDCIGCYKEENFEGDGKVLEMMKHEVPIALGMYNIRIQILCKLKKTILVRELLNWLISINVKPNSITYNHFIHGYCKEGKLVVLKRAMFDPFDKSKKMHNTKSHMRRVFIMNDCNELMQKYLGPLGNVVDSYDLLVNNSLERLHRNKILLVIKKKHIEMFSKIAENKKDGEAVVISNERNSAPGRTSHSEFMEEGSCSEVKESKESQIEVII